MSEEILDDIQKDICNDMMTFLRSSDFPPGSFGTLQLVNHYPGHKTSGLFNELIPPINAMTNFSKKCQEKQTSKVYDLDPNDFLSACNTFFVEADIPWSSKKILFAAYSMVHHSILSQNSSPTLEYSYPIGTSFTNFTNTFKYLGLEDPVFDYRDYKEKFLYIVVNGPHTYVQINKEYIETLFSCLSVLNSKNISEQSLKACNGAIEYFKSEISKNPNFDDIKVSIQKTFKCFHSYFKTFSCILNLNNQIKKVGLYLSQGREFKLIKEVSGNNRVKQIMKMIFDFAQVYVNISPNEFESPALAVECLQVLNLIKSYLNDTNDSIYQAIRRYSELIGTTLRERTYDDEALLASLATYISGLSQKEWPIATQIHHFYEIRSSPSFSSKDIKSTFQLIGYLVEFLSIYEKDTELHYIASELLLNYSTCLLHSKIQEDIDVIGAMRLRLRGNTEFPLQDSVPEIEKLIALAEKISKCKLTPPKMINFMRRFQIFAKLLKCILVNVPSMSSPKVTQDILHFFPDLRHINSKFDIKAPVVKCPANPNKIEIGSDPDQDEVFKFSAKVLNYFQSISPEKSVTNYLIELKILLSYQAKQNTFMDIYARDVLVCPILLESNDFSEKLTNFLIVAYKCISDKTLSHVVLMKLCFDLSLCIMYSEYASPQTVQDRWAELINMLSIPFYEPNLVMLLRTVRALRYNEYYGTFPSSSGRAESFEKSFVQYLVNQSDSFFDILDQIKGLYSKDYLKSFESFSSSICYYKELTQMIDELSNNYFHVRKEPRHEEIPTLIVVTNFIASMYHTLVFAINENVLEYDIRPDVHKYIQDLSGKWPIKTHSFYLKPSADSIQLIRESLKLFPNIKFENLQNMAYLRLSFYKSIITAEAAEIRTFFNKEYTILLGMIRKLQYTESFESLLYQIFNEISRLLEVNSELKTTHELVCITDLLNQMNAFILRTLDLICFHDDFKIYKKALERLNRFLKSDDFPASNESIQPRPFSPAPLSDFERIANSVITANNEIRREFPELYSSVSKIGWEYKLVNRISYKQELKNGKKRIIQYNNQYKAQLNQINEKLDAFRTYCGSLENIVKPDFDALEKELDQEKFTNMNLSNDIDSHRKEIQNIYSQIETLKEKLQNIPVNNDQLSSLAPIQEFSHFQKYRDSSNQVKVKEASDYISQVSDLFNLQAKYHTYLQRNKMKEIMKNHKSSTIDSDIKQKVKIEQLIKEKATLQKKIDILNEIRNDRIIPSFSQPPQEIFDILTIEPENINSEDIRVILDKTETYIYKLIDETNHYKDLEEKSLSKLQQTKQKHETINKNVQNSLSKFDYD